MPSYVVCVLLFSLRLYAWLRSDHPIELYFWWSTKIQRNNFRTIHGRLCNVSTFWPLDSGSVVRIASVTAISSNFNQYWKVQGCRELQCVRIISHTRNPEEAKWCHPISWWLWTILLHTGCKLYHSASWILLCNMIAMTLGASWNLRLVTLSQETSPTEREGGSIVN